MESFSQKLFRPVHKDTESQAKTRSQRRKKTTTSSVIEKYAEGVTENVREGAR